MPRVFLYICVITLLVNSPVMGQRNADSLAVADAASQAARIYGQTVGNQSHIFNGSEYVEYHPQPTEYEYLFEDWNYGSLDYAGEEYDNVPLFFDIVHDQLITNYTHGNKIQLLKSKIKSFKINGRTFVHLRNGKVPDGFYELLYDGDLKYYLKRQKVLITKINGNDADLLYELRVKYYVLQNGVFKSVKGKGSVMSLLKDRKRELKKFIRDNKLSFKADRDKSIVRMLSYYDQISH